MRCLLDRRIVFIQVELCGDEKRFVFCPQTGVSGKVPDSNNRMPQTLSKGSVIFIDSYNGKNNGVNVSQLESVLRDIGMVRFLMVFDRADCLP